MKDSRLVCVLAVCAACSCFDAVKLGRLPDGGGPTDGGAEDGAVEDSGVPDGGVDAAVGDAGTPDGGQGDAGFDSGCFGPPTGIIAWWDADDVAGSTAYDIVGGNDGTMDGGVALVPGEVGNAFDFGDGGGVVEVPDSPVLYPVSGLTIEAWVYPTDTFRAFQRIVSKQVDDQVNVSTFVLGIGSAGGVYFGLFRNNPGQQFIDGRTSLTFGAWNHVAGVWDGTSMRVFLDGVMQPETSFISPPLTASTVPLRLGRGDTSTYLFAGQLDEVTLYNRPLSTSEIAGIYAAGHAGKCKPPGVPRPPKSGVR